MKKVFILFLIFIGCLISHPSFALTTQDSCTTSVSSGGVCPDGKVCKILPTCNSGCKTGCQKGYYLSDGDNDPVNDNMSTKKGICEICPPGYYCEGGYKDKQPCPEGYFSFMPGSTKRLESDAGEGRGCRVPDPGYCVVRAMVQGTAIISNPNRCLGTGSDTSTTDLQKNHPGFGSGTGSLAANYQIPCPVGTFDERTYGVNNKNTSNDISSWTVSTNYNLSHRSCTIALAGMYTARDSNPGSWISGTERVDNSMSKVADSTPTSGAKFANLCPAGTYSDGNLTDINQIVNPANVSLTKRLAKLNYNCKAPQSGYCSSIDGVNGNCRGNFSGAKNESKCGVGLYDSRTDVKNLYYTCSYPQAGSCSSLDGGTCSDDSYGMNKQIRCPVGTFDERSYGVLNVLPTNWATTDNYAQPHKNCQVVPNGRFAEDPTKSRIDTGTINTSNRTLINEAISNVTLPIGAKFAPLCPSGSYSQSSPNNITCITCSPGTYRTSSGATSSSQCLSCSPGSVTNTLTLNGASSCTPCSTGKWSSNSTSACSDCGAGSYTASSSSTGSWSGTGIDNAISSSAPNCVLCPAGTYSNQAANSNCTQCNAGSYQPSPGQSSCSSCGAGYYTNTLASKGATSCSPCGATTYDHDSSSTTSCTGCGAGYQTNAAVAATSCTQCAANYPDTDSNSSTACSTICSQGTWSNAGATSCTDCGWSDYSTSCEDGNPTDYFWTRRSITSGPASQCSVSLAIQGAACTYCASVGSVCSSRDYVDYDFCADDGSGGSCEREAPGKTGRNTCSLREWGWFICKYCRGTCWNNYTCDSSHNCP